MISYNKVNNYNSKKNIYIYKQKQLKFFTITYIIFTKYQLLAIVHYNGQYSIRPIIILNDIINAVISIFKL